MTIECDDIFVAILGKERGKLLMNVECALRVDCAIIARDPIDLALFATVVPAVLRAWTAVQIKLDP